MEDALVDGVPMRWTSIDGVKLQVLDNKAGYLDGLENDGIALPYWADIWPPALTLGTLISESSQSLDLPSKKILDFGSGTGILGLFLLRSGCKDVISSDYLDPCIDLMKRNLEANGQNQHLNSVKKLDWGFPKLGWPLDRHWIFATDVLFEPQAVKPVANIVGFLLNENRDSVVVIGDPNRPYLDPFLIQLKEHNLHHQVHLAHHVMNGSETCMRLVEIRHESREFKGDLHDVLVSGSKSIKKQRTVQAMENFFNAPPPPLPPAL